MTSNIALIFITSVYFLVLWLAASYPGSSSQFRPASTPDWMSVACRLKAKNERPLGWWLVGLGWQCGRWVSLLGGCTACRCDRLLAGSSDLLCPHGSVDWDQENTPETSLSKHYKHNCGSTKRLSHQSQPAKLWQFSVVQLLGRETQFTQCYHSYSAAFCKGNRYFTLYKIRIKKSLNLYSDWFKCCFSLIFRGKMILQTF